MCCRPALVYTIARYGAAVAGTNPGRSQMKPARKAANDDRGTSVNFEAGDVKVVKFGKAAGPHTKRLAGLLAAIQTGRRPDTRGWVRTACIAPGK